MSFIKKLAGETAIYGTSNILNKLLNFIIVTPYLTRVFDEKQEEYAIHGIMYAFAGLLMVMLTYGMETAFFRFGNKVEDRARTFATASFSLIISTLLFVGLLIFFAPTIAGIITEPSDAVYVIYFILIVGFDVLAALPFAKLRLEARPIRFGILKLINMLIVVIIIFFLLEGCPILIAKGYDQLSAIYQPGRELHYVFIANLVASGVTFLLLIPMYFEVKPVFDRKLWQQMFFYAAPLIIVGISGMINQLADRYLLKEWLPGGYEQNMDQVGIYNGCVKIAVLMNLFTQAFKFAVEPFFFKNADKANAKIIYSQVGQAFVLVGSLAFLGIMLYLDIVQHLIGESYREGLVIVPILLIAYLLLGLYYNFAIWYKIIDKTKIGAYISIGGAMITLGLNYILIPKIGLLGSAWAALGCFGFMISACYLLGQKYYPVPYKIGRMLIYVLFAIGIYGISTWIRPWFNEQLGIILAVNTLLLITYLGLIYFLERKEIRVLLGS